MTPPDLKAALRPQKSRSAVLRAYVDEGRKELRSSHASGASGVQVVREWTEWVERAVVSLFGALLEEEGFRSDAVGIFALGGFGRRELSPYSDVDLLIAPEDVRELSALAEALLYPLWDAGLEVHCVARTVEENREVARDDLRSKTSLLEARLLYGSQRLADRFEREVLWGEIFGRGVRAFVQAKLEEMEARSRRYGDTVYLLEPNVKESPGYLRDAQTAVWVAKVRFKVRSRDELLRKGVLPEGELAAIAGATEFFLRIRNHLHFAAGRCDDRLSFEAQEELAPFLGYRDEGGLSGGERFLQDVYSTANRVSHFTRLTVRRAAAGLLPRSEAERHAPRTLAPGMVLRQGEIHLSADAVEKTPLLLLEVFEAAQVQDADLSPEALEVVRENLPRIDDRFRRDPRAVQAFFRILSYPRRVATTLMRMHDVHLLNRFIPEFERIYCRMQRDLYHAYPVDVHSLFAVQELRRLARGELAEEFPLPTEVMTGLSRPEILYLAALLHDVGKGEGSEHERRGAEIALAVGERMGLSPEDRERLVFLVANHLLLSHTAERRDLHDEELIFSFARKVGSAEALGMLYLLTFADIRAVGPGAWTSWKDLLLRELYLKAREALEEGTFEAELGEERVQSVRERLRQLAVEVPPEEVERFLQDVESPQYLLANPVEALLRHVAVFARRGERPVAEVRPVPAEGYAEVLVVTRDRPGLFSDIAGLMAAHRLNILSAVLNTRGDGWALDVVHVCGPAGELIFDEAVWRDWRRDLDAVLTGQSTLEAAVGSRLRRRGVLDRPRPKAAVRVRIDNEASRRFTVVDITAADRLGLLYDVARTFAEQGLTIRLAKIATNIDRVSDSFYVEDVGSGKITDRGRIEALQASLSRVLKGEGFS
ncbi:MAG: [protein-PII] uridylyltransferase [Deltaproteobacteria bacterium]|nr:[protein-PII] uridylyltransferase [Deltaproteobacteria bacterium]